VVYGECGLCEWWDEDEYSLIARVCEVMIELPEGNRAFFAGIAVAIASQADAFLLHN
jgi:hypothetical protein